MIIRLGTNPIKRAAILKGDTPNTGKEKGGAMPCQ
jgi:hypothetical protein